MIKKLRHAILQFTGIPEEQLTKGAAKQQAKRHRENDGIVRSDSALSRFVRKTLSFSRINIHAYYLPGPVSSSLPS